MKLAAAALIPSSSLVASDRIQAITGSQSSQGDAFAHRGNPARTGEMLGVGLTVTDPVFVHGYYSDDSSGVMRLGRAPAVYNDVVYLGDSPFKAYQVGHSNELWTARLIGTNFSYAAVGSGVVCVADIDKDLYGLDADTGAMLWSFGEASATSSESPVIANGLVYVDKIISDDVRFPVALDARTGVEVWTYDHDGRVESPMTVVDDLVLFGDDKQQIYALDARTGEYRWQIEHGIFNSGLIAVADGVALLGSYAVELSSGDTLWQVRDSDMGRYISNPAIANGVVYFGTEDGLLIALDLKTGEGVWQFDAGDGVVTDPAVSNGVVYFGINRFLYALDATSGKEYWRYEFQGYEFDSVGPPVLGGGYLFVTFGDAYLYAITNQKTTYYLIQDVDVYSDPSTSSAIVEHLSAGTTLDDVGEEEQHDGAWWRRISVGDVTGWIDSGSIDYAKSPAFAEDFIFRP